MAGASAVVVKHARTNNALAVSFAVAAHEDALGALLAAADAAQGPGLGEPDGVGVADRGRATGCAAGDEPTKGAAHGAGPPRPGPQGIPSDISAGQWVLQRCFDHPALIGPGAHPEGASAAGTTIGEPVKFTIRANVLAVGRATVLVHSECLIHCATKAWRASDWANKERHISNHSVQRSHLAYDAAVHTMTLHQLGTKVDRGELAMWRFRHDEHTAGSSEGEYQSGPGPWGRRGSDEGKASTIDRGLAAAASPSGDGAGDPPPDASSSEASTSGASTAEGSMREAEAKPPGAEQRLMQLVLEAVAALFARASATGFGTEWLPQPGCFELFGIDFLPEWEDDRLCLRLLEVNEGPALGALAMPAACGRVAEDAWRVVADPWLETARRHAVSGTPVPNSASADGRCAWAASLAESLRFGSRVAGSEWVVALVLASSREELLPVFLPEGFLKHAAARLQREGD